MKANPGGTLTGGAILGRETEIAAVWQVLEKRSCILSAERRVGKTSILRKMAERPQNGWIPVFCLVESERHPISCVEKIYEEASRSKIQSQQAALFYRMKSLYKSIAGTEITGWKLPSIKDDWKRLLNALVQDVVENTNNRVLMMACLCISSTFAMLFRFPAELKCSLRTSTRNCAL